MEQLTLILPSELVCQITDKARQMNIRRDAVFAVLLKYGLKAQEERERELHSLVDSVLRAETQEQRETAFDVLGESVFKMLF